MKENIAQLGEVERTKRIELRLAIAEARINALEKVVIEIADTIELSEVSDVMKALEKLEFAGVEAEEAAAKEKFHPPVSHENSQ